MAKTHWPRALARTAIAIGLAATAASAAADVLVVRSSGPSARAFPPGRTLPDNRRVTLRDGDRLVVLDARGTRSFRGPGRFNASVAPRPSASPPAAGTMRPRIAAVRGAPFIPGSDASIWQLDAEQSGTHCLAGMEAPSFWRADAQAASRLTIEAPDGTRREVAWPAGEASAAWPADLPIRERADYRLSRDGAATAARIRLRRLTTPPDDVPGIAAALIAAGCQAQLDLLVDSLG